MTTDREDDIRTLEAAMMRPTSEQLEEAIKELAKQGFLRDTGKRRSGRIVWKITEAGKAYERFLNGPQEIGGENV
jgi:DNA-binding PadR family transcriptional regulator